MEIVSEHRDGEITVFVNSETPEIQLTTRREEAKATVNENSLPIVVVAENISSVKDAAKYVDTFDDVIASLPQIMEAATAAQRAEKAEEGATEAKDLSVESAAVASASASSATLSAQKASESETKALASEQSALNSANSASASKTAAQNSALAAAESASSAKQDLDSIKADAELVAEYAPKAIQAAESAENAKASAISAADRAENASQSVGVALEGKQDKLTAGEGIKIEGNVISTEASLPDNVYTEDNLIGGKDIEIVKKSGGIDENTLACWHFDNDGLDILGGLEYPYVTVSKTDYKLGTGSCSANSGNNNGYNLLADSNSDFTIEGYFKAVSANEYAGLGFTLGKGSYYTSTNHIDGANVRVLNNGIFLRDSYQGAYNEYPITTLYNDWFHLVLQRKGTYLQVFLNGAKILERAVSSNGTAGAFVFRPIGAVNTYMDEVRISKVARYDGDFEPPTAPYEAGSAGSVINFTGQSGKNIGEVYYSQSSLATDNAGALPLFTGETIASANTIYPDFYTWVESHTELHITSEAYESALATYGECSKYVISGGSLRLPKLTNYIKMANTAEGITQSEAGLPNITGTVGGGTFAPQNTADSQYIQAEGAFLEKTRTAGIGAAQNSVWKSIENTFDASLSSEVYGKSDTVTPAHTTLYPWVFAYNATVPASTAQVAEFQNALSGKVDLAIGVDNSAVDYVVESYSDDSGNWYRVYKSGWTEQGGFWLPKSTKNYETITLPKPMANALYYVNIMQADPTNTGSTDAQYYNTVKTMGHTDTSFNAATGLNEKPIYRWEVKGQGA